jgi:hypothetical protein
MEMQKVESRDGRGGVDADTWVNTGCGRWREYDASGLW